MIHGCVSPQAAGRQSVSGSWSIIQDVHVFLPSHPLSSVRRAAAMLASPRVPLLVQLVVTRRCNLACGYCDEFDASSPPVETALLERRIDHAAGLGTLVLTLTGGEPLLHPQLDTLIARAVSGGMVCTL